MLGGCSWFEPVHVNATSGARGPVLVFICKRAANSLGLCCSTMRLEEQLHLKLKLAKLIAKRRTLSL